MLFANNTQSCATLSLSLNNTFSCLMSATSSDLRAAIKAGLAIELFPFRPVLDGPQGIVPDLPARLLLRGAGKQVPLMAGTVLDEGLFLPCRRPHAHNSTATSFIHQDFKVEDIETWLNANYTPSPSGPQALRAGLDELISLYPNDPSVGSPFGTGNETFGTGPGFKRAAAIRMVFHSY
jgi:acetylcholinesterase